MSVRPETNFHLRLEIPMAVTALSYAFVNSLAGDATDWPGVILTHSEETSGRIRYNTHHGAGLTLKDEHRSGEGLVRRREREVEMTHNTQRTS